jgi:hypothetical protein
VQADAETEIPDGPHCIQKSGLQCRLSTGKDYGIQQAAATLKESQDVAPLHRELG